MHRAVRVLTLVLVASCGGISTRSGDEATDEATGVVAASAGSSSAGAGSPSSEAGAGSGPTAGSSGTAGTAGGAGIAEPSACGSYRPVPTPNLSCRGIKTGLSCEPEGQLCPCLPCGLGDLGARACRCDGSIWSCSSCQYPQDWRWPAAVPFCTDQADKLPCASEGELCQGAPAGEVCLCYRDPEDFLIWDCDKPPAVAPW